MRRASYEFHQCLGRGGFGEVYLVTRTRNKVSKKVAIKLLKDSKSTSDIAMRRLADEGRMLAFLDHPAILAMHEMTKIRGRLALVTEYVQGVDLSRCVKRGFLLPVRVVLGIFAEVASALHCAQTTISPETGKPLRLVHRDIKPQNIRLSRHGAVKLLDFGIARSHEMEREAMTAIGDLPLTPGYTAPEAFTEGKQEGPADVFAMGSCIYRMLVGEKFYEGVELETQLELASEELEHNKYVTQRLQKLPVNNPELAEFLGEMLAYAPEQRPKAQRVQQRLEALSEQFAGPGYQRFARSTPFPDPPALKDAPLTGLTITEDAPASTLVEDIVAGSEPNEPTGEPPLAPKSTGVSWLSLFGCGGLSLMLGLASGLLIASLAVVAWFITSG